ncbi:Myeloma-overexpressed gene 2 protein-like [Papilio machaon]|uniref:Myeloma-overexpressed gene 2 protein-like n=1 Tax=Papilio machaon TaxID=76193 RepID=A0A194RCF2_PAPMA|nr:Myeloma-overexpressed gene 2 protein-like [Papilio machaon]
MKPTIAADEMFPEGVGPYMDLEEAGGPSNLLMDLAANEKAIHADFFNDERAMPHDKWTKCQIGNCDSTKCLFLQEMQCCPQLARPSSIPV